MIDRKTTPYLYRKVKWAFRLVVWLALWTTFTATAGPILTISPDQPAVSSCLGFGAGAGSGVPGAGSGFLPISPNMGFIYKDIPAFELSPGDVLAFDLGAINDFDVEIDIHMATTSVNGETTQSGAFQKVVSNTYTPLKPRGDTVIGNFDMRFLVDGIFSFPGGGLIIRFSNGSDAYREDQFTCDQVGVVGTTTDTSGNFVLAFWKDVDGIAPWTPDPPIDLQQEIIGGFQIIKGPTVLLASDTLDQSGNPTTTTTVGDTITYRVKAQNPDGQADVSGVTVTATLDSLVSFVQSTPAGIFDAGPPATLQWAIGTLTGGAEATLEIDLDVPFNASSQTLSNSAQITASDAPFEIGLSEQSDIAVLPAIDLTGAILDSTGAPISTVLLNEPFIYRIVAGNSSALDGAGVEVTVTLPENIVFQQANATPGAMTTFVPGPPETVIWPIASLLSGDNATLDIDVIAQFESSGATLFGSAVLTGPEPGTEVQTPMPVERAVEISSDTLDGSGTSITTAKTGDAVQYGIVVRNISLADATGLQVTAELSPDLEFQQSTPTPVAVATFNPGPPPTIVWEIGTLAAGAEATLVVDFDVPFSASGQPVRNGIQVTAADAVALVGGTNISDITIDAAIALSVTTLDATDTVTTSADIGDSITYRVTVTNSGGVDATGLEILTTLADNQTFEQATAQPTPVFAAGPPATVSWNLGTLPPGSDAILDVGLEINFGAGGLTINNATEISAADAVMVAGLTADSEITISNTGADLLNGGSGNCFIATAAYGSYLEPEVVVLRKFRDDYLLTNIPGRAFVAWYYRNSPSLAAKIAKNEPTRVIVRLLLSPLVYAVKFPLPTILVILTIGLLGWNRKSVRVGR